ncbi:MAG TPA: hypothetical protein VN706_00440 [Gemmatimonadaceae bacterium]|nr:hypothetical protein [Gemmatimonadaceae bacterium]
MRSLIRARDETHRLSVELALNANDIAFTTNAGSVTSAGYYRPMDFYVMNDADYDRAREVVLALDDHAGPYIEPAARRRMVLIMGVFVMLLAAAIVLRFVTGR